MFIIIDSGSSATRLYLMDSGDLQVIDRSVIQTGVNSTIDKGSIRNKGTAQQALTVD